MMLPCTGQVKAGWGEASEGMGEGLTEGLGEEAQLGWVRLEQEKPKGWERGALKELESW